MSNKDSENLESNRDAKGHFKMGVRSSVSTEFKPGEHWRPIAIFRDKNYLTEEYVNKQRSTSEIAAEHNVTDAAIFYWLRKNGIPCRSISEVRQVKKWGSPGKSNGMYGRCGSENPRWIDGSSPERQKMYARSFWKELITTVYKRDNYKCRRCGAAHKTNNRLHAHHVKPWAGNPDSRFELSNIVTLCSKCHQWVHSKENIDNEFISS